MNNYMYFILYKGRQSAKIGKNSKSYPADKKLHAGFYVILSANFGSAYLMIMNNKYPF